MKLRELINRVDRSKTNCEYLQLGDLAEQLSIHQSFYIPETEHCIRSYWLTKWVCTDAYVGLRVYGYEKDESFTPFAISHQEGRKCSERFMFFCKEQVCELKTYLLSLIEDDCSVDILTDEGLDEDMQEGFEVAFSGQLLSGEIIIKSTGEKGGVVKTFNNLSDISSWERVIVEAPGGKIINMSMKDVVVPYYIN